MCGIAGIVSFFDEPVSEDVVKKMTKAMTHRGPDDEGFHFDKNVGLGHRRLSIIDVTGGHQPIANEQNDIVVICNGEVYNFEELNLDLVVKGHHFATNSDSETIVHGFEEYGLTYVEKMIGMFAFAVWDSREKQLILARDRIGKKPLFYSIHDKRLVFASEIKAILTCSWISRGMDVIALDDYMHYGFIPGERTIYKDIKKILPGHVAVFRENRPFLQRKYWEFPPAVCNRKSRRFNDYLSEFDEILRESVKLRLRSDVPLGVFLSGGLDSSIIAAVAQKCGLAVPMSFTIKFGEESFDESGYARKVADWIGTQHKECEVNCDPYKEFDSIIGHFDEPFADSSAIPTYYLSKITKQRVKVALSGDGGDELFGGYARYVGYRWARALSHLPRSVLLELAAVAERLPEGLENKAGSPVKQFKWLVRAAQRYKSNPRDITVCLSSETERRQLLAGEVQEALSAAREENAMSYIDKIVVACSNADFLTQMMWTDAQTYLVDNNLVKLDRMSMASGLEVRCPLLDHRLIEFAFGLPDVLKVHCTQTKRFLKRYATGMLPDTIVNRRKQGFSVPMAAWLSGPLKFVANDILFENDQLRMLLEMTTVRKIFKEHSSGYHDHASLLWALVVLGIWLRRQ